MIDLRILLAAGAIGTATPALAETRSYETGAFRAIDIATGLDAIVQIGKTFHVEAHGQGGRRLDRLVVEVSGDTLHAYLDHPMFNIFDVFEWRGITLTITVPAIDKVAASSGADVLVATLSGAHISIDASSGAHVTVADLAAEAARIEVSSGASIELAGACRALEARASSGADLEARNLECVSVQVDVSSGGDAHVFASGDIRAATSSGGDLTVYGNPQHREIGHRNAEDIEFVDTP